MLRFIILPFCLVSTVFAQVNLSVLTLNVYAKPDPIETRFTSERMERICETLRTGPWDIVMLQEVWTPGNRERFRSCGFPYVMDLQRTGAAAVEWHLGSGLMILSKFPLEKQERLVLSKPGLSWASLTHGETLVDKSVYLAQANLPRGEKVWLANTHLIANYCNAATLGDCDSYESLRFKQGSEAAAFVTARTGGRQVIFGGDFNSGPHPLRNDRMWKSWQLLFHGLRQASFDPKLVCTSCGSNFFKSADTGKIDHVFVSADLTPIEGRVVLDRPFRSRNGSASPHLSDHFGWETLVRLNSP